MAKLTKKRKEALAKFDKTATYTLTDAIKIIKQTSNTKYESSVDVEVSLRVDQRTAKQMVRRTVM